LKKPGSSASQLQSLVSCLDKLTERSIDVAAIGCVMTNCAARILSFWFALTCCAEFASAETLQNGRLIDVFLIAGQSNAVGVVDHPDTRPRVPLGIAWQFTADGRGPRQAFDISRANARGAWPEFALTYNARTGHQIAFVQTAVGSTSQTAACYRRNGNWDDPAAGGNLWAQSVSGLESAMAELKQSGRRPVFKGVLWVQGEADGRCINRGQIVPADYQHALRSMIARYRSQLGANMPFYIFRTGDFARENEAGFVAVRQSQEQIAASDSHSLIVFRGAEKFAAEGQMNHAPNGKVSPVHYSQRAYDEMGAAAATTIIQSPLNKNSQ
jgi:hypothetical protein